jgi:transposase
LQAASLQAAAGAQARELVEAAGSELVFLPPYNPDLNPIEMIFAKIKQALRPQACRTRQALRDAI